MEEALKEAGLTTNECKVYTALLGIKYGLAGQITEKSGVHRRNVYDALERLIQKGLVSYIHGRKLKYFKAEPPENLLKLINNKEKTITEILPKLNKIFLKDKPDVSVKIYSGKQGLKNVLEDQLLSKTEILAYGKSISNLDELKFYFPQYRLRRIRKKITVKIVLDKMAREYEDAKNISEIKYLHDNFFGPVSVSVFDNKVAIMIITEMPTIIMIENKEFYESQKKYFDLLWQIAKF
ncbi:MAG: helix-turn-helix domain-containing protein [Candidatus Aenigmarchaeota archaeon]|nr:helix-turn-helix domain-containing protein [Candidatus Aenigmarchaeota archaeon]